MREIKLTQGMVALVSDEDYEALNQFKWHVSKESNGRKYYAVRRACDPRGGKRKSGAPKQIKVRMHRQVMGLGFGFQDSRVVHHKDDDGLNNQRENLEILIDNNENMHKTNGWQRKKETPWL